MKTFGKIAVLAATAVGAFFASKMVIEFIQKSDKRERSLSGSFRFSKNKMNEQEADEILDTLAQEIEEKAEEAEDVIEDIAEEIEETVEEAVEAEEETLDAADFSDDLSEDDLDSLIG
ncbi:MAG: hypothetical protein IJP10_01975 [Clostridia bacterium]|nr:hypothetical protein [Oscillospiraceae bacterium]MBQ6796758.1 hypothetical protein [Clostridia bacterium]